MQISKTNTLFLSAKQSITMGMEIKKWQMYELNKLLLQINNKPNNSFFLYINTSVNFYR